MRFLLLLLLPAFAFSQEIDKNEFDRFDSLYKVVTKDQALSDAQNSLYNMLYVKVGKFTSAKRKKAFKDRITVYIENIPSDAYALNENSNVTIIFEDGQIKQYHHKGKADVYGKNETAALYFPIYPGDPLFTKEIKSIRFSHSKGQIDLDVTNTSLIKNMLALVNNPPSIKMVNGKMVDY
jgi:hypothetical protein